MPLYNKFFKKNYKNLAGAWQILRRKSGDRGMLPTDRGQINWITLHEGGVLLALASSTRCDEVQVQVQFAKGTTQVLTTEPAGHIGKMELVHAPLPLSLSVHPGMCTVTVTMRGHTQSERFEVGPECYTGYCDGIRDYCLEGWLTPLFSTSAPRVQLIVDGIAGEPVPLNRFRREFQFMATGQGGWNGFSLPLPMHTLDGQPHHLAIKAGKTSIVFGTWISQPQYSVDSVTPNLFTGWYIDTGISDAPTTIRIVRNGITLSETKTHPRADVKTIFGREISGFAFRGQDIQPESQMVVGPEGTGLVLGQFEDELQSHIRFQRTLARAHLLASDTANASALTRHSIRTHLADTERTRTHNPIAFKPVIATKSLAPVVGSLPPNLPEVSWKSRTPPPVCAIIPVYKGLADLKLCLASLIPQIKVKIIRAVVINDSSPDPDISRFLAQLVAEKHPGLTILENESNLGFIGTVNRGFTLLEPGEDVLLINTDTILPPGAVERLARHCHARPGVASVTPMSNNATILSFPTIVSPNLPILGLDVIEIDQAFATQAAEPVEIPTGIGFCMHINRHALNEVGFFSLEWDRGYCEEVDWCLKARDLGWVHLAATDTFVIHEGSISFSVAERLKILATNHVRLEKLYPEYIDEVQSFIRADPLQNLRIDVLVQLLKNRFKFLSLHLMHGLGGGTKRYINDIQGLSRSADHEIVILMPLDDSGLDQRLSLSFNGANFTLTLDYEQVERTLSAIEAAGISVDIHVSSRLTFKAEFLKTLLSGDRPYTIILHDFQWYCPRVQLVDRRIIYCGEPPPGICQMCVSGGVEYNFADHALLIENDFEAWLGFNVRILQGAVKLLAPSEDTARRYRKRFNLPNIVVSPHPEPRLNRSSLVLAQRERPRGSLRIAVVGAISRVKGFDVLVRIAERAARDRMPFFLTVVGYTTDDERLKNFQNVDVTGRYEPSELKTKLDEIDPNFVFLPSIWPETYSYVLSEIWEAGYPVVAFDIGAPADRIKIMGGGTLIPVTRDSRIILDALFAARDIVANLNPMEINISLSP